MKTKKISASAFEYLRIASRRILLPLVVACMTLVDIAHPQNAPASSPASQLAPTILELGKPIEVELRGGETRAYKFHADAAQFIHAVVMQEGIDVVLTLYDPAGKQLAQTDSLNGSQGPEPISAIAESSGDFKLEVASFDKTASPGTYEVRLADLRAPTDMDRNRLAAERAYMDGAVLFGKSTAVSVRAALTKWNESFALWQKLDDKYEEALNLNGIAAAYGLFGEKQKELDSYIQSAALQHALGDRIQEAATLNDIGYVYSGFGDRQKTIEYYNRALSLVKGLGDRADEAATLNNLGLVYNDLGENQKALECLMQALPILRAVGDRLVEAATLNNIARVYTDLGEYQKALEFLNQALPLRRALGDRQGEAIILNNIGNVYYSLADYQKALDFFNQSLPLRYAVSDSSGLASTLNSLGLTYSELGDKQKALDFFNQALPLHRANKNTPNEARALNNIGKVYSDLGDNQKALDYYNQALPVLRAVGDRTVEARTLSNMGVASYALGDKERALDFYDQALVLHRFVGDRLNEAGTMLRLLDYWSAQNRPALAIFFGKEAIDRLQQARRDISGLEKADQLSFLKSKEKYYRQLAALLISQGRLPEAQQVLDMLKVEEYSEFTQLRGNADSGKGSISKTPGEEKSEAEANDIESEITSLGTEWSDLHSKKNRSLEEETKYNEISAKLTAANQRLQEYLNGLYAEFGKGDQANARVETIQEETGGLQSLVGDIGPKTVVLYTLVLDDKCIVMVITPATRLAREVKISKADLRAKVFAFDQSIENSSPEKDVQSQAHELYDILIAPIEKDLRGAQAKTLVWSLDDVLRYVPLAALYDGKQYLVERYQNVVITTASAGNLKDKPDVRKWRGAAMGVSKDYDGLGQLNAVPGELDSVVRSSKTPSSHGPIPGTILLDDSFTEVSMENALEQHPPLVHIASHYVFEPGDDNKSYLLLGGKDTGGQGFHLTLADLRDDQRMDFKGIELLTLSGCQTASSSNNSDGREIDGLGITAQRKGAKAVVATLWPVEDTSVGLLMATFYKLWITSPQLTKAEALQKAQLTLLRGAPASGAKTNGNSKANLPAKSSQQSPGSRYSNPFYWAPFILIGNWK